MSKSKYNKLLLLLGILALCCGMTWFISNYEEEKENIKNSEEIILSLDTDTVTALSWKYGSVSLGFHKEGSWTYDGDKAFPVDEEKMEDLLGQFQEFGVAFVIENVTNYGQYGLDNPICTIYITAEEETHKITLGDYSTMDEKRYVSIGDGNVYLVNSDPYADYEIGLSDLIKHDELPSITEATQIQFAGLENYSIVYEEESNNTYCAEDVYFMDNKPLDTATVNDYLDTVSALDLSQYMVYGAMETDLPLYGLENPELTITVDYPVENEEEEIETESLTLHISRNPEEVEKAKESKDEDAEYEVAAYARVGNSPIIYRITSLEYSKLTAISYDDLRHKEVMTASFEDIYQVDVTLEGMEYSFTSKESWGETIWSYGEEEIELGDFRTALRTIEAESFTSEKPAQKEEVGIKLYLDNETYPELTVVFYRYDGDSCLTVVDGKTVSLVPRSDVVDLIEAVNGIVLR